MLLETITHKFMAFMLGYKILADENLIQLVNNI